MRRKMQRYAENAACNIVIEPGKEQFESLKGCWQQDFFKNTNPITLEVACGRGEYSIGLAKEDANANFIGIDIKGERIWKGSTIAKEASLDNIGFLRANILELESHFASQEVDDLWIVFPDPMPKDRHEKRRLTHPRFIELYKTVLKHDGWCRLKTDSTELYEYTHEVITARSDIKDLIFTDDLYNSDLLGEHKGIKTRYEKKFREKGENIKYLKFRFIHK